MQPKMNLIEDFSKLKPLFYNLIITGIIIFVLSNPITSYLYLNNMDKDSYDRSMIAFSSGSLESKHTPPVLIASKLKIIISGLYQISRKTLIHILLVLKWNSVEYE